MDADMKNAEISKQTSRPDTELPMFRQLGPRPLALHLSLAMISLANKLIGPDFAVAAAATESVRSDCTQGKLTDVELPVSVPDGFVNSRQLETRGAEGLAQLREMIRGIDQYHHHPYRRHKQDQPVVWSCGTTCLRDYSKPASGSEAGPVVLFVPSLVNRAYVLDLLPQRSMLDFLSDEGLSPFLVDWGAPSAEEREFTLADYITKRLVPMVDVLADRFAGRSVHLAGYCMGGTLAMALAACAKSKLSSLTMLAAPWDFHAELNPMARLILSNDSFWQTVLDGFGELPVDLLQAFFASLDPDLGMRKFTRFASMAKESKAAEEFVALEDWLNDGVPLARKVATECFADWYGANSPHEGRWTVANQTVRPQDIALPSFFAIPQSDKIVPAPSAMALADKMTDPVIVRPTSGHIGMVTGGNAPAQVWRPLADWIQKLA